ncbi:hypothetical protein N8I77_000076 [Diaporthe amygdali]|uniref:Uncharacterized protein n=1 Tax=Phomopsis amygdali TaxID=1214568 RepID=A0AAD9SP30_PHOAM|nr:hypothetical protein N8I77_000076 [Diaporthe amygdali]
MNLSLSLVFLVAVVSTVPATHLVLPLYVYPTEGAWDYVYKVVRDNPAVTFDVILNVEDGPGSRDPGFNDEWRNATSILKSYTNVQTWGYVHAAYNSSYLGEMAVNISYWARWHLYDKAIALDGIFIDEVPNDQEGNKANDDVYYMTTAVLYARRIWASYGLKGPKITLNPGTGPVHPEYYDLADSVNVFEDFPWAYDKTPWSKSGWWADHDGTDTSAGGTAREVLRAVADQRRAGKPVTFVWFDIKNADWCNADDPQWVHCSVTALRDLAREILQPVGVRALYSFYGTNYKYNAYSWIANNLNSNEAVNLDGNLPWAQQNFDSSGPGDKSRRVYSWGNATIKDGFADRVANLKEAASSGKFAKVFSWTTSSGDSAYVKQLVDSIKVDGIIYGYSGANYDNGAIVQTALKDVTNAVNAASGQYYLATTGDTPW